MDPHPNVHTPSADHPRLDRAVLCWPAERESAMRGWSLRSGTSPALRANSAFPFADDADLGEETLSGIELYFRDRARVPAFRITPFGHGPELDSRLAEVEYERLEETWVMTREVRNGIERPSEARYVEDDEAWLDMLAQVGRQPIRIRAHYGAILPRAPRDRIRVAIESDGQVVAVALGLIHDAWVGLFDVVTDPDHRGRGHARAAIRGVLYEASARDVRETFLYVTSDNDRALELYTGLGFREAFRYHYRVLR
ncbi:MAG: GNAT family N-acetyltransferase [Planctomycetota bacterium]|jgi:ribosomal protein S18 acetylase RimI-like enzyme